MPISALDEGVVRAIGSTSIIADACAAVKELIDNALDAGASTITIEIASNTLESIQVKDNGHGIPAEDRLLVCRHSCTSKLRSLEELSQVGGTSLGFRGEALASIAETCNGVTVTTRVHGEIVGSSLTYGRDGELVKMEKAAHAVGTTVRLKYFAQFVPVRREFALKNISKTLKKTQKLVQEYCLARPKVRFTFKVVKAKADHKFKPESWNWNYAPKPNASIADAVLQVLGRDAASVCRLVESPIEAGFQVSAFLYRSDADLAILKSGGSHFVIDGRPLSTSSALVKDIGKLYKSHLRQLASNRNEDVPSDPLLYVSIACPPASYDANIEPAKDDLLFSDPKQIVSMLERLFEQTYGALEVPEGFSMRTAVAKPATSTATGFDLLMARKPSKTRSPEDLDVTRVTSDLGTLQNTARQTSPSPQNFRPSPSKQLSPSRSPERCGPPVPRRSGASGTRATPDDREPALRIRSPQIQNDSRENGGKGALETWVQRSMSSDRESLSSPYEPMGGKVDGLFSKVGLDDSETESLRRSFDLEYRANRNTPGFIPGGSLQKPFVSPWRGNGTVEPQPSVVASPQPMQHSSTAIGPCSTPTPRQAQPVFQDGYPTPASTMDTDDGSSSEMPFSSLRTLTPEVAAAMDFEYRKKAAIEARKAELQRRLNDSAPRLNLREDDNNLSTTKSTNSPHENRYRAAKASLGTNRFSDTTPASTQDTYIETEYQNSRPVSETALGIPDSDPRGYAILHASSIPQGDIVKGSESYKIRRKMTSKLPFERIQPGTGVWDLQAHIELKDGIEEIRDTITSTADVDPNTNSNAASSQQVFEDDKTNAFEPIPDIDILREWEARIVDLICNDRSAEEDVAPVREVLELDLGKRLQEHIR